MIEPMEPLELMELWRLAGGSEEVKAVASKLNELIEAHNKLLASYTYEQSTAEFEDNLKTNRFNPGIIIEVRKCND